MKKIGLICITLLAGLSLSACSNLASQQSHKTPSSSSSSTKVVNHHKQKHRQTKSSSSRPVSSNNDNFSSTDKNTADSNGQDKQQVQNSQQSNEYQSQPNGQQAQQSNSNALPPASDLHDFVNRYGESPAAYLSEHSGMSPEQAVQSVPNDMKTSGEIQDTNQLQQGQDPFN